MKHDPRPSLVQSSVTRMRGGFTLIEIMVVVVILALLATLMAPRFSGIERRRFQHKVDQISDMLTVFAQRQQIQQKPVGIIFNNDRRWLQLVVLERGDGQSNRNAEWLPDIYVQPIKFPDDLQITEVLADGEPFNLIDWPLSTTPNERRPSISISISDGERSSRVMLEPHAIVPSVADEDHVPRYETEDLDAAGRGREEW